MNSPDSRKTAYSYRRFSTPRQMNGDSLRRQTKAARDYASTHNLRLDEDFSFEDLGTSAFRGKNAEQGKLREFLVAIENGAIPSDCYLLVENLDRISRDAAYRASAVLCEIVQSGVTLVTLDDQRVISSAALTDSPFLFLEIVIKFIRANEESLRKSAFTRANWEGKRARAAESLTPMTSRCPSWLRLDEGSNAYVVIPDRAALVRRMFDMVVGGHGLHRIAETFNREKIQPFGDGSWRRAAHWHRSYIKKITENPAVIGTFVPHHTIVDAAGKRSRVPLDAIPDYFPRVIDPAVFGQVQSMRMSGRAAPRARSSGLQNVFAGLASCHRCGGSMTRVNKGSGAKGGHPYLVCSGAKVGAGCRYEAVRLDRLEQALAWDSAVLAGTVPSGCPRTEAQVSEIEKEVSRRSASVQNLVEALLLGDSGVLAARLVDEEAALAAASDQLRSAMQLASATTPLLVRSRLERLLNLVGKVPLPVAEINAVLRQCFETVVIDTDAGLMRFRWKQGGETPICFQAVSGVEVANAFWTSEDGTMRPISKDLFLANSAASLVENKPQLRPSP